MARRVARGEIWTFGFKKPDKRRPVVVITRDDAIPFLHSVLVAPITSTIRGLHSEVLVGTEQGLKHPSAVNLDHVQAVEQSQLSQFVGRLTAEQMRSVCRALAVATGCEG